ncbi:DEAD/DEAH box helicase [Corynebacterium antarcticum]|uniref:DEAD/DEAH box helicase n=1 Tax=Corynebacterium antarcticum TaxID=2800405 RepID=UPI002002FAC9|nr:DEAD/DEAH box helicase [Corynebacterium antarcticum]MCK7661464.1 DUF3427 domain-containing protein [Corynebacterium antarcticum]
MDENRYLHTGAYETPITNEVAERIRNTEENTHLGIYTATSKDKPRKVQNFDEKFISSITRLVSRRLSQRLSELSDPEDRKAIINQLFDVLDCPPDKIRAEELLLGVQQTKLDQPPELPAHPLTSAALLTNSHHEPSLSSELSKELASADEVNLLCAFIRTSGIRTIHHELRTLKDKNIPFRIITSTYCGATEAKAVQELADRYGGQVKISYDTNITRLHAKAWLFRRNSGFDTAYIGSSNLSSAALGNGLEWNVRTSRSATPNIVDKFIATFDTYWDDPSFVHYSPDRDFGTLQKAISSQQGNPSELLTLSGLEVSPLPHQVEILEALKSEREEHDRHRNLVVAATGTGKTVLAALDYRDLATQSKKRPRLLFVAHRKEILNQARRTYAEVLQDPSFGSLLVDGETPQSCNYIFASIQSLSRHRLEAFPPNHFDIIVIDEFHHAEAPSYKKIIDYFQSQELLALTATPERADGINVAFMFDYRLAYELRLWDALSRNLLSPMQYFGIHDNTDLRSISFNRRSGYDSNELSKLYVDQGSSRVSLIINEIERTVIDVGSMKALGFCVSVVHAEYMAEVFSRFGIPSAVVSAKTNRADRTNLVSELETGKINCIFSVDVFNEGVDIPCVNTILLLRPTQSPTIFLQQIGRGLRKFQGKSECVILDFIGQHVASYDLSARYRSLLPIGSQVADEVSDDFPSVPAGSTIQLDRRSKELVLENVKRFVRQPRSVLLKRVAREATPVLSDFLLHSGCDIVDLYRSAKSSQRASSGGASYPSGWTGLLDQSGVKKLMHHDDLTYQILDRVKYFLHVDDPDRIRAYLALTNPEGPTFSELSDAEKLFSYMLIVNTFPQLPPRDRPSTISDGLNRLRDVPEFYSELKQVFKYQLAKSRRLHHPLRISGLDSALRIHAEYSRAELTAAFNYLSGGDLSYALPQTGVYHYPDISCDIFYVTLDKSDSSFSESTRYDDFPISPTRFHWQSQSTSAVDSKTGQRYIHHQERNSHILLATRKKKLINRLGIASPFTLLGEMYYSSHKGERPISFEWNLIHPMPMALFTEYRVAD